MSLAVGQPLTILMMVRPADRTIRVGVCHQGPAQPFRFGLGEQKYFQTPSR